MNDIDSKPRGIFGQRKKSAYNRVNTVCHCLSKWDGAACYVLKTSLFNKQEKTVHAVSFS
jgi:hypothetical protein